MRICQRDMVANRRNISRWPEAERFEQQSKLILGGDSKYKMITHEFIPCLNKCLNKWRGQTNLPCRRIQIIYIDTPLSPRWSITPHSLSVDCSRDFLPKRKVWRGRSGFTMGTPDRHLLSQEG